MCKMQGEIPEVVSEIRKSKAPLIDIKWCTDGTFLLVASEDGRVLQTSEPLIVLLTETLSSKSLYRCMFMVPMMVI